MSKRVLVTGASGFIGHHALHPLLTQGFEVHAVAKSPRENENGIVWHSADLLDVEAEKLCAEVKATHLLHLVWYAVPGLYWTSPENERWVQATLALVEAFQKNGGKRAVLAGTCAEYDWQNLPERIGEDTPISPSSLYGACKHRAHELCETFSKETGMSLAWGRIFFLYGPGEPKERLVPSVINALLEGKEARTTSGEQIRDFLHVEDVANAFTVLLESNAEGAVNIASGEAIAIKDLIQEIGTLLGKSDLLRLGALPSRANEPARIVARAERLTNEVGFHPRYSLSEGLTQTIEWWKANKA